MFKHLPLVALCACVSVEVDTGSPPDEEFPQELWSCKHIESRDSAFVAAQTIVYRDYIGIAFHIRDEDQSHTLQMDYERDGRWSVEANLLFLDCNSEEMEALYVYWE